MTVLYMRWLFYICNDCLICVTMLDGIFAANRDVLTVTGFAASIREQTACLNCLELYHRTSAIWGCCS